MLRNDPAKTWIKPDNAFNSTHPNSQNFLIKGDNLEALKLLKNAYEKKIKMIYIDPPYNTGNNDFVYKDDRKYTPKELSSLCGMSEEECKKMLEYYSKGKNSHSAWLTFMYPRLSLARNLLKEDGMIFISIDDNEQAQLKLLCDEIFGEENFVANFVWKCRNSLHHTEPLVSSQTEYILCYAKNKTIWGDNIHFTRIRKPFDNIGYKNPDNDPNGAWVSSGIIKNDGRPKYEIVTPNGTTYKEAWLYTRENMQKFINNGEIWFGVDGGAKPRRKSYEKDFCGNAISNLLVDEYTDEITKDGKIKRTKRWEIGTTESGSKFLNNLFGEKVFDYPKPYQLIKYLITISTHSNDIILDFFAGSGTTAHAVMELNAEDNGNRRFILVQLPEEIKEAKSKTAYDFVKNVLGKDEPKISDITQERIIRASKQIEEKHPEYKGDLGFRVLELEEIPSGLREIRQSDFEKINHFFANEDIDKMLDIEAILQTFCLYDGIPLDAKLEAVDLGGYMAYKFDRRIYFLSQGFQTKHLQEFLRKLDEEEGFCVSEIVLLAYCFESARHREIAEAISYSNRKSLDLKLLVRE